MTKLYGNANLVENYRIDVDDGESHAVCLDLAPPDGTGMGPSALELTLMGFAGCYATIFVLTAKKMRIAIQGLKVETRGIKSEEVGTITEVDADIAVKCNASEDRIKRLHQLTVKGCPVGILFEKAGVKISYHVKQESSDA